MHSVEEKLITLRIQIWGVVQGVGFRPFISKIAKAHHVSGIVYNAGGNVTMEVTGSRHILEAFVKDIREKKPEPSEIVHFEVVEIPLVPYEGFKIAKSTEGDESLVLLPADLSICEACAKELKEPSDKRHLHPFISCMACGPRYSIVDQIPYDRHNTAMKEFEMCDFCNEQYTTLEDRRYHAQTISCHDCGPTLIYRDANGREWHEAHALEKAVEAIKDGGIIGMKGIGGYHLVCTPMEGRAVANLRTLKGREEKPFAVMFSNLAELEDYCVVGKEEAKLLESKAKPIVLLERKESPLVEGVYRSSRYLGAFLPYTAMQILMLDATGPLVMTSANVSDRPMIIEDEKFEQHPLINGVLYHERKIRARMDDSVVKWVAGNVQFIRRARGYVPIPIYLEGTPVRENLQVLAVGGQLKTTYTLTKGSFAYPSEYIGDLEDPDYMESYHWSLNRMKGLMRVHPQLVVSDTHPDYRTTTYAKSYGEAEQIEWLQVQHHYAHIASVMAEKGLHGKIIGVAFDGTGYGTDHTIWGGEFLICTPQGFTRGGHLKYVKLLGGDRSVKEAWKSAMMYLYASGLEGTIMDTRWPLIKAALLHEVNTIASSSMGRLFDAVSSILDISHEARYEGECAILLENEASQFLKDGGSPELGPLPYLLLEEEGLRRLDLRPAIRALVEKKESRPVTELAYGFHQTIAMATVAMCEAIRREEGLNQVALSGGVFQNSILLERTMKLLKERDFDAYTNTLVPPNDGGISLGQAFIGIHHLTNRKV